MKDFKIGMLVLDIVILGVLLTIYMGYDKSMREEENMEPTETALIDSPTFANNITKDFYVISNNHKYSDNNYEEEILNNNGEVYKLIELNIDGFNAYMLVVYDPSRVRLALSKGMNTADNSGKQVMTEIVKENNALAGINGGGFFDNGKKSTDRPVGYVIKDGKILWNESNRRSDLIGFTYDNKLTLVNATGEEALEMGMRDAVEFGPNLIVNGVVNESARAKTYRASRTVIAQREDGIVLMLVTNGGSKEGPKMSNIISVLLAYGAYNAANLDGGASTQMVIGDKLITTATSMSGKLVPNGRKVINGFIITNE